MLKSWQGSAVQKPVELAPVRAPGTPRSRQLSAGKSRVHNSTQVNLGIRHRNIQNTYHIFISISMIRSCLYTLQRWELMKGPVINCKQGVKDVYSLR